MSFSSFYEESDKQNRFRWKVAVFMILAGTVFVLFTHFSQRDESPEAIEKRINQSSGLKRVDRLCEELPKPNGFNFYYKVDGGNTNRYGVEHRYTSEKPSREIKQFFVDWFTANGWEFDEYSDFGFRKNKQMVAIEYMGGEKGNYSINCGEDIK